MENFNYFTFFSIFEFLIQFIFLLISILLSIAYFTIFERKVLASIQGRKGPNFIGFFGILQPIADGVKLFLKETIIPIRANKILFIISPIMMFFLSLLGWIVIPFNLNVFICNLDLSLIYIFSTTSLNVYGILGAGWASNSRYSFLGALRAAAQVISYEIIMGVSFLIIVVVAGNFNLTNIVLCQKDIWFFFLFFPFFVFFFIAILAETNRLPFDLPEAESELVSGYNVEYSGFGFALFFLAEYSVILLFSHLIVILFLGGWLPLMNLYFIPSFFWFSLKIVFILFCFVWIRGTLPRYRYDQLMNLGWVIFVPITFSIFFLYCGFIILYFI